MCEGVCVCVVRVCVMWGGGGCRGGVGGRCGAIGGREEP